MQRSARAKSNSVTTRRELVARLNPLCQRAFKAAADSAKMRGNPYVELAHFVEQLALAGRSDLTLIAEQAGIDPSRLAADLTRAVDALPYGSSSLEEFSDHIFHAIQEGWSIASFRSGRQTVRSGDILLGALGNPALEAMLVKMSREFEKIDADAVGEDFDAATEGSIETERPPAEEAEERKPAAVPGRPGALAQFATDLTAQARAGRIDPVVGRDAEIRQIVDILMRRRQNNPILTGEAGVGKTAVVEGFARRIAAGEVPPSLASVALWMLDVGLMQAGASVKGEFERRLKQVIEEVQSSPTPIILFIDEAHTLIGAGGAAGTGDAANLLKPALARGELRTIAATTWSEYKQHIEPDPALTRRFQPVKVDEPSEEKALLMLRGVASSLEKHHKVQVLDEALASAVELSHRYIPARQLPDKAISLLDTACARVAVSQHAIPAGVEDLMRRGQALEVESGIIGREAAIGIDTAERAGRVEAEMAETDARLAEARERWEREKALVAEILDLRARLRGEGVDPDAGTELATKKAADAPADEGAEAAASRPLEVAAAGAPVPQAADPASPGTAEPPDDAPAAPEVDREALLETLRARTADLAALQGEAPLVLPSVDRNAVAAVAQDWTGIPVGRMLTDQAEKALALASILAERVVGQDHAMRMIAERVQTSRAGLDAPNKPVGVFLLVGPSGVGKTETALALAETLYGGEQNLISINMSEFQEPHTVSTLKGAPPGYKGYGKGGVLTEAVRRRPYSVILLDEVEKAHSDVHEIFFQVFDKGIMDDSEGRRIDFKNTLILLTSNVGSEEIMRMTGSGRERADPNEIAAALRPALLRVFPAAFLGRVITIPYYPLSDAMIDAIARLQLERVARRLRQAHGAVLHVDDSVYGLIRARCTEVESGGRMIDAILTGTLLPELSRGVLNRAIAGERLDEVRVGAGDGAFTYDFG